LPIERSRRDRHRHRQRGRGGWSVEGGLQRVDCEVYRGVGWVERAAINAIRAMPEAKPTTAARAAAGPSAARPGRSDTVGFATRWPHDRRRLASSTRPCIFIISRFSGMNRNL